MRKLIIFCFVFLTQHAFGQYHQFNGTEYIDTTGISNYRSTNIWYYSVGGKYPKSSTTLVQDVKVFLQTEAINFDDNGYVTFRFQITGDGKRLFVTQVLQTDERYKASHLDERLVNQLYDFLNTMMAWKLAKDEDGIGIPYNAFVTFKIKDGEVVNIIP